MIRVLLLILMLMSSFVFAQTDEKPQAVKIDEFERATNGEVKARMDFFYTELNNNPTAQGYIINYGTTREIAIRERQIRIAINFRRFDASRITIVNGGFRGIVKTEFWSVPAGAENPNIQSSSTKMDEFERVALEDMSSRLFSFYGTINQSVKYRGFIVNYGTSAQITTLENQQKKSIAFQKFDASKITFIRSVTGTKIKTEFWLDTGN